MIRINLIEKKEKMLLRNIIVYAILIYVKRKRALEIKQNGEQYD